MTIGIPMVFGWTQDDGAMNAGPAPLFEDEEAMKVPIKNFAHALTDKDYESLFSLYPPVDFADEVKNYNARKEESDPIAPVHYFRVSRILRDMMFTCPSIDFGYEMSRQSKALDPTFSGIRLYDLNQSMLTPMFKGAGMPYMGGKLLRVKISPFCGYLQYFKLLKGACSRSKDYRMTPMSP